jgi:hypothetical protein
VPGRVLTAAQRTTTHEHLAIHACGEAHQFDMNPKGLEYTRGTVGTGTQSLSKLCHLWLDRGQLDHPPNQKSQLSFLIMRHLMIDRPQTCFEL